MERGIYYVAAFALIVVAATGIISLFNIPKLIHYSNGISGSCSSIIDDSRATFDPSELKEELMSCLGSGAVSAIDSFNSFEITSTSEPQNFKANTGKQKIISESNCGKSDNCPIIRVYCYRDDQCKFCSTKNCEMHLFMSACKKWIPNPSSDFYKINITSKECQGLEKNIPDGLTPEQTSNYCVASHECIHTHEDFSICPSCGSEKFAYSAQYQCLNNSYTKHCINRKTWTPSQCSEFTSKLNEVSSLFHYVSCLCKYLVPGKGVLYKEACDECRNKLSSPPLLEESMRFAEYSYCTIRKSNIPKPR